MPAGLAMALGPSGMALAWAIPESRPRQKGRSERSNHAVSTNGNDDWAHRSRERFAPLRSDSAANERRTIEALTA